MSTPIAGDRVRIAGTFELVGITTDGEAHVIQDGVAAWVPAGWVLPVVSRSELWVCGDCDDSFKDGRDATVHSYLWSGHYVRKIVGAA